GQRRLSDDPGAGESGQLAVCPASHVSTIPVPSCTSSSAETIARRVFASAQDHRFYLDCLRDAACAHDVAIHGYVLMTNHVHLLPRPDTPKALARMMQTLGRRYVGRFTFLHQRT